MEAALKPAVHLAANMNLIWIWIFWQQTLYNPSFEPGEAGNNLTAIW